jgi:glycosyltransferase involved in cell wall biosynthesis
MELMINEMDLENTVHYRGVIPQPELFTRLTEYDVGIGYVPYEQYMGSPALKVLEYMAANLLVIASDTEGIKKQITHNINGILFQNTPESIARTILDVIENGWSLEVIEAGYDYALKNSWEAVVRDNLLEVYNKLLSGTV